MADFLVDYSNLAGAGSAFQGFAQGYQNAQDQKMKRQEMQSKMDAQKAQMDREADQTAIQAKLAGLQKTSAGQFEEGPMGPAAQGKQKLDVFKAGGKATTDANGNIQNISVDPESLNMLKIQNQVNQKNTTLGLQKERLNLMQNRFGETQSQNAAKAGKDIEEDPVNREAATARQSLSRGKSLLDGKSPLTYNNLNAVQQDVISGMTKGGQSSEGKVNREMQESWIGRWNNLKAKAGNYGEDNDIRTQDPGLYKQIQSLLNEVDTSIAKNMAARTKSLASSYSQTSNKKQRAVVDQKVKQYDVPAEPPGLVGQGLVGQQGLVSGAPPQQAPAAAHPEANQAAQWAQANIKNPDKNTAAKAQAILQRLGQ